MIDVIHAGFALVLLLGCGCVAAVGAQSAAYPEGAGQFNVRDFGAKGDGRTDDTAAFVKAIQAVEKHFQVIYVPNGTYLVSDRIAWGNWITLQCQSRGRTVIRLKGNCPGYGAPREPKVIAAARAYYGPGARSGGRNTRRNAERGS